MADYMNLLTGNDRARYLALSSVAIATTAKIAHSLRSYKRRCDLRQLRDEYSQRMKSEVEELAENCKTKISEERSNEITSMPFDDLRHKLQAGELSCVEVLWAYQLKAVTENVTLNFITQPIREAETIAQTLDSLDAEVKQKLPLFGIPVSVKENFNLEGYTSTIGISKFLKNRTEHTQVLVQALKDAGAVPFIRTNLVQTMMSLGSHNPIYGQTRNPKDSKRGSGGSSSGESAAIGCGASILGLGTDIWGSVRVPAAWCGIYSLKPTVGRLSALHLTPALVGQTAVRGTPGFMSRDMQSLIAAMKVVSTDTQFDLDPSIPRVLFNEEAFSSTKPLTIGYLHHCPPITPTASAINVVTKVTEALTAQGHKMVEWEVPVFDKVPGELQIKALFGDAGDQLAGKLEDDEISYCISKMVRVIRLPVWFRGMVASVLRLLMSTQWTRRHLLGLTGVDSVSKWYELNTDISRYRQLWIDDWKSKGIDAIILPAVPVPAEFVDKCCISECGAYVYLLNLVNFPAGVVPAGEISEDDEENDWRCYPQTDAAHKNLKQMIRGSAGLPLSIQCATLPFREETCLRLMDIISKIHFIN